MMKAGMNMIAVVKEKPGAGFVVREIPIPVPGPNEVLIQVQAVGICGSDLPIFAGKRPVPLPFVPGHEFAGIIAAAGKDVADYQTGDRVAPGLVIHCGECLPCRRGEESLCDRIVETGIHVNGAFAEYVTVPVQTLHRLPEHVDFTAGASIDPVASAYRPVKKAGIGSEDLVVVFGPGPIGLFAGQLARAEGARQVIVVGLPQDSDRLDLARTLGLDAVAVKNAQDLPEQIRTISGGDLPRVVLEATGSAGVFLDCLKVVDKGGIIVVAGIVHDLSTFDFAQVVRREIRIAGSICYTWREFRESLKLVADGRVQVQPLITHHLPLQDIGQGLEALIQRQAVKVMLYPGDWRPAGFTG
jgi:L-iditol 2-dehydrogenase